MRTKPFRRNAFVALAVSLTTAGCASTRAPISLDAVEAGDRVRVRARDGATGTGIVSAIDTTSLTLALRDSSTRSFPLATVTDIDRRIGSTNYGVAGLVVGAGIGFAVGLVKGAGEEINDAFEPLRGNEKTGVEAETYVVRGVLIGGAIGCLIGLAISGDEWQPVRSDRFQLAVEPTRDGARVTVFSNH